MSLIHWWPLNGDTKDYGTRNNILNSYNNPTITNGKIGQCYSFIYTSHQYMSFSDSTFMEKYINNHSFSLACWVKTDGTGRVNMFSLTFGLRMYGATPRLSLYNSSRTIEASSSISINDNKWHHVCGTYDVTTGKICIYVDGTLTGTTTYPSGYTYSSSWNNGIYIGYDPNNNTDDCWLNGSLNDVRIYDHALSAKEVHEISKGLCLHYTFENPWAEGTVNVVPNPSTFNSWSSYDNGYTSITDCELGGKKVVIDNILSWCGIHISLTLPSTGTYTISAWCKPISRTSSSINQTVYTSGGGISDTDAVAVWENLGTWQRVSMTRTYTSTSVHLFLIAYGGDGTGRISCEYTMPQIELKDHATPYVNGTRPAGKIYDSSGFRHDGVLVGDCAILNDSIYGDYSLLNNSANIGTSTPTGAAYVKGDLGTFLSPNQLTISYWAWKVFGR